MKRSLFPLLLLAMFVAGCTQQKKDNMPVVGFIDAFEDATIAQAKQGFFDALKKNGYSEDSKTIKVIYRNAQGNIPTLTQVVNYMVAEKVNLLATSTTLSTITAAQKTKDIPLFMMVAPTAKLMNLEDKDGKAPKNLFGVEENLAYIDTSVSVIKTIMPTVKRVGALYNQSEPQSVDAFNRIKQQAQRSGFEMVALPVNSSSETQLVVGSLLDKKIDAFFALPDNVVFASFETIVKGCNSAKVPIFTSEAGLVKRGAVAAFGADLYQWGYQSGEQAAQYLKTGKLDGLKPEMVKVRKRLYNPEAAKNYKLIIPSNFEAIK